jgi:hypothetical protein
MTLGVHRHEDSHGLLTALAFCLAEAAIPAGELDRRPAYAGDADGL